MHTLVTLAAMLACFPALDHDEPPERGREPWVFRCIFEDRSRMLILAPTKDVWIAFNPETCGVQKVWRGGMRFRGKVWDFSQDNCAAATDAEILAEAPSTIADLPDEPNSVGLPVPWTFDRVAFDTSKQWVFTGDGASITGPPMDLSRWSRVYIAFDETSRAGPFRVELSDDGGTTWSAQHFDSTMHGSSDADWQWNFKRLVLRSPSTLARISQPRSAFGKRLRNLRVFGDAPAWWAVVDGRPTPATPTWLGYTLGDGGRTVSIEYELIVGDGQRVRVRHTPDCTPDTSGNLRWSERFAISGLPAGHTLVLAGLWTAPEVSGQAELRADASGRGGPSIVFPLDGESELTTTIKPGARP